MKKILISKDLSFPLELITQSVGILAKRRAGKSYTARKVAEGVFEANQQICIIDPKGDWWGIRYAKDGKGPGKPIFILGGERGDIPLEVNSGSIVAKLLVEERVSILLDLSLFRKSEVSRFMAIFLEDLYRLKAQEKNRTPLMLMIDEADAIAPQKPQMDETRMLGAIEDIVRRGGQRGIGCTMISQRSAVLNKNVLTQIQVLMCLRTIAPQDLAALDEWIKVHGEAAERKVLMDSLPALPVGDVWVWSPGWPSDGGIFQRIHVDGISTFDSGATPKPGEKRVAPRNIAHVNLDAIRKQMSEVLEKAKENDPKELKARIVELEKQVKSAPKVVASPKNDDQLKAAQQRVKELENFARQAKQVYEKTVRILKTIFKEASSIPEWPTEQAVTPKEVMVPAPRSYTEKSTAPPTRFAPALPIPLIEGGLGRCERALLSVMATRQDVKTNRSQLALLSGYSKNSSGFANAISKLNVSGMISRGDDGCYSIENAGLTVLGSFEPLPTGTDLQAYWLNKLGKAERTILSVIISHYPEQVDKSTVAEQSAYSITSSGFANALSVLRTLELISGGNQLKASDTLF